LNNIVNVIMHNTANTTINTNDYDIIINVNGVITKLNYAISVILTVSLSMVSQY